MLAIAAFYKHEYRTSLKKKRKKYSAGLIAMFSKHGNRPYDKKLG